jgi:hypothetical protein
MPPAASSPTLYRVPCQCGKELTVSAGQAGSQIPCECGAIVDIPTIRELRRFAQATGDASAAPGRKKAELQASQEDYARTALALVGAGLLLLGLVIFGSLFLFQRSLPQEVNPQFTKWVEMQREQMSKIPEDLLWGEWVTARDRGLGEHHPFDEVVNKERAQGALIGAYVGLAVSTVGVVVLAIAFMKRRRTAV